MSISEINHLKHQDISDSGIFKLSSHSRVRLHQQTWLFSWYWIFASACCQTFIWFWVRFL